MAMGELNDRQKAACVGLLFAVFWAVFREAVHAHDAREKISGGAIPVEVIGAFAFGYIVTVFRKRRK